MHWKTFNTKKAHAHFVKEIFSVPSPNAPFIMQNKCFLQFLLCSGKSQTVRGRVAVCSRCSAPEEAGVFTAPLWPC